MKNKRGKLRRLAERDGGMRCHYCGKEVQEPPQVQWHEYDYADRESWACIDHVVPRSKGGADSLSNLVIACWRCNSQKSDKLVQP